jgi:hypothetical protein
MRVRFDLGLWTAAALAAFVGALGLIGSDALWLVPLGERIAHGHLPHSVPYATAASTGWHDVPAGGEVVFWALYRVFGGIRGLAIAQAAAAAVGFGVTASGLRRETSTGAALPLCVLVLIASLPAVAVVNASLFSLALFPLLLALLESESRVPSRRIWLSVPLLALWGNLHGEVLAGLALLACYLLFARARREPGLAALLLAGGVVALFVNSQLWSTPRYYSSVFHSVVARQGSGLWAPLGLSALDVLLVVVAVVLAAISLVRGVQVRLWEGVALLGLAVETVRVARTGPWLLFVLTYPAARALQVRTPRHRVLAPVAVLLGVGAVAVLVRGPADPGSRTLARAAARSGEPVLAEAVLGQEVALAGGKVWIDNPIDAFAQRDQRLYVDWLAGKPSGAAAVAHAAYVLVKPGSRAGRRAARDGRLRLVASTRAGVLYRVR